jgi:hypothetical protein
VLYKQSLLVWPIYDGLKVDGDGFGVAGTSGTEERFQPEIVSIVEAKYEVDTLAALTYQRTNRQRQELSIDEVLARVGAAELQAPIQNSRPTQRRHPSGISEGKLSCVCPIPTAKDSGDGDRI